jgi:hypothetical protein
MRVRAAVMAARLILSAVRSDLGEERVRGSVAGLVSRTHRTQARLILVALAAAAPLCAGILAPVQPAFPVSTATTFAAGTGALTAVFTPAGPSSSGSTGTRSLGVDGTAGGEAVVVTVPPTGMFTLTVVPGTVIMHRIGNRREATGMLQDITVSDTRNYAPGWSLLGQESAFTSSGAMARAIIPGDELGWVPVAVSPLAGGASLGPRVAPGTRQYGLGTGSVLAYANAGSGLGTDTVSASLTLDLRGSAPAKLYTGSLTITYLETGALTGGITGSGV